MINQLTKDGELLDSFSSIAQAAKATGTDRSHLSKVLKGKRKSAGGFLWRNSEEHSNTSENITKDATYEALVREAGYNMDQVKSVKIWQNMAGETRYSIVAGNTQEEDKEEEKNSFIEDLVKAAKTLPAPKKPLAYGKRDRDTVVEVSLPDMHFGKLANAEETGTEYNLDLAAELFMETVRELAQKVSGNRIERFLLPIGNDGLNSDSFKQATTKGTPMNDSHVGQLIFRRYKMAIIQAIDYLATIAPVDVVIVPGNHDFESMFKIGEVIDAWYRNHKFITVDNGLSSYKYYKYGKCLVGFDHGDKIKPQSLAIKILKDNKADIADVEFFEWHLGHLHKEKVDEFNGVKVRHLPSLCPADSWHRQHGYDHWRCAQAHIWNKNTGYEGYVQVNK